jgi:hypothetical protein
MEVEVPSQQVTVAKLLHPRPIMPLGVKTLLCINKTGKWTNDEDENLKKYVDSHGERQWKKVSRLFSGRTAKQCAHRWYKVLKPALIKGPWTVEEDQILKDWVVKEGAHRWSQAAALIKGRSGKQCRERWFNTLDPDVKKGSWGEEEDRLIFDMYQKYGSAWSKISKALPGRTENAIKNRFYSTKRKITSDRKKILLSMKKMAKKKTIIKLDEKDILKRDREKNMLYQLLKAATPPPTLDPPKPQETENSSMGNNRHHISETVNSALNEQAINSILNMDSTRLNNDLSVLQQALVSNNSEALKPNINTYLLLLQQNRVLMEKIKNCLQTPNQKSCANCQPNELSGYLKAYQTVMGPQSILVNQTNSQQQQSSPPHQPPMKCHYNMEPQKCVVAANCNHHCQSRLAHLEQEKNKIMMENSLLMEKFVIPQNNMFGGPLKPQASMPLLKTPDLSMYPQFQPSMKQPQFDLNALFAQCNNFQAQNHAQSMEQNKFQFLQNFMNMNVPGYNSFQQQPGPIHHSVGGEKIEVDRDDVSTEPGPDSNDTKKFRFT